MKINFKNECLPFCPASNYLGITSGRSLTCRQHLKLLRKKLKSCVPLLWRFAGLDWGVWSTTLRTATLASVYSTAECIPSCLVPQCPHPRHWSCHERFIANCDWTSAYHTSGQSSNPWGHPTCWMSMEMLSLWVELVEKIRTRSNWKVRNYN